MLQAVLKNKIGHAISNGTVGPKEDTLTSSVIGLMQYLPDHLFWRILKGACGRSSLDLPENIGKVEDFHFWEKLSAIGTKNSNSVEPDVWLKTEDYYIIIEAKRSDNCADNSQYEDQWSNQIKALLNENGKDDPKPIIYIAIGGNESLLDSTIVVDEEEYTIHTASWYNLLECVLKELSKDEPEAHPASVRRVLVDIVAALEFHRILKTIWFDSLTNYRIEKGTDTSLYDIWDFDNLPELSAICPIQISGDIDLRTIWTIAK